MPRHLQICSSVGSEAGSLASLRDSLIADGWLVETVFTVSDAEYRQAVTLWQRLRVRWSMYPGFVLRLLWACRRQPDAVRIVTTNPFFAPWLVTLIGGRQARTIMVLYDLYPDALDVGKTRPWHGLGWRWMAAITRAALRRSTAVVYLGERIKAHADSRYGRAGIAAVIPPAAAACDSDPNARSDEATLPVHVLYCGHLGRMHDVGTLRDLFIRSPARKDLRLVFHASGPGYDLLRQDPAVAASSWRIQWDTPLPPAAWAQALRQSPVALITLRPGAEKVSLPSKTYSAMAAGQAILAVAPEDSDLAGIVRTTDCGWVVRPGDADHLDQVLHEIVSDLASVVLKRAHARAAALRLCDVPVVHQAWRALLAKVVNP